MKPVLKFYNWNKIRFKFLKFPLIPKQSFPLSPPKYGIVELYYLRGVYMSQDKQMKAVSPFCSKLSISHRLSVGLGV